MSPGAQDVRSPGDDLPLEHHRDQLVHVWNGGRASPTSRPWRSTATRVHSSSTSSSLWETKITVLPWAARRRRVSNSFVLLGGADAGGRLVEDQHAGAQPQQAQDLQLLALAHGERFDLGLQDRWRSRTSRPARSNAPRPRRPCGERACRGAADEEVVDHPHGREVQRILVQHADAVPDGVGGRAHGDRLPSSRISPLSARLEAGQDLHQRALAGPVLAQDALDGAGGHDKVDAVVGLDGAEVLVDVV